MDIMELAAQLGKTLKEDERLKALEVAKEEYTSNVELQKKLVEYEVQQKALQGEITKEERDTIFIEIIQKRIDELYNQITTDPAFLKLNEAQAEVNELMNAVNATITANITGETPSSCTHNCSTCGGCH
jgi:cell fate (sporulation/competence/biofilm development) regulator YmcA (YheA/YmcA/DUF963 family)